MIECRTCKDWRKCPDKTKDGFLFAHLRFCPFQVLFILSNSEALHSGRWPEQYSIDEPKKKQLREEGYFVKPAIIIAEVEKRLETCHESGKDFYIEALKGRNLQTISDESWDVLMYLKGWKRKVMPFWEWRRKYRK